MRQLNNWVLWRAERGKKVTPEGEPVLEKVLKRTNGANASSNNPSSWTDFHTAVQAYNTGKFSGIGFVFQQQRQIIGLDLDGHFEDGEPLTEIATHICNETYVEISPSGTGAHAYFIGKLPHDVKHKYKNDEGELEIYNDGRFFTFTGEMAGKHEISRNQRFIDRLVEVYFHKPKELHIEQAQQPIVLQTSAIMRKMLNNDSIKKLFEGDTSDYQDDQSAADMALANHLAFWTGKNYRQMDELFRESGLFRQKWDQVHSGDGKTYGQMTLERAISECKNVYKQAVENPQASKDTIWDDVVTFEDDSVLPFPSHIFPAWLETYIDQVAQSTQTPREMAAMGAFTALSIATAKKFNVNVYGDWYEPINTYLLTLMPPSSKKSQVFKHMLKPIYDYQRKTRERVKVEAQHRQDEIEAKTRQLEQAKKKAANASKDDKDPMDEVKRFRDQLNELEPIHPPTYVADDVTPEVLASLLQQNDEKLGIVSAEGGLFSNIQGRYSDNTNYDVYLNGYSADYMSTHRMNREAVELERPHLTVGVFAQPSVIQELPKEFFDRGLMSRFLYSLPKDNRGERQIRPRPIDKDAKEEYAAAITALMNVHNKEEQSLTLSYQADLLVQLLQTEIEDRQGPGQDFQENPQIEAWAGKLAGQLMRLAGLIHMSKVLDNNDYTIEVDTIESVEALKDYFVSHMKKAFNITTANKATDDAVYLLKRIEEIQQKLDNPSEIKRTKLWQSVKSRFTTANHLDDTLKTLQERNYLKSVEKESNGGRPTRMIVMNPIIG
jgi:hypothetical protein